MWRRILISILVMLVVGGTYVWFSLTPDQQVNLEAAADLDAMSHKLEVARQGHLPVSFSGEEVKALAVQAIKQAKIDDRIKGVDVQLGQDSITVALAVDIGAKVVAVTAVARPALTDNQLTVELAGTKIGVVPVPVGEVLERLGQQLPDGVTLSQGKLSVDLERVNLDQLGLAGLSVENGTLQVQPK